MFCTMVNKPWLAYCSHYALIQTQHPGNVFLLFGLPNEWRGEGEGGGGAGSIFWCRVPTVRT